MDTSNLNSKRERKITDYYSSSTRENNPKKYRPNKKVKEFKFPKNETSHDITKGILNDQLTPYLDEKDFANLSIANKRSAVDAGYKFAHCENLLNDDVFLALPQVNPHKKCLPITKTVHNRSGKCCVFSIKHMKNVFKDYDDIKTISLMQKIAEFYPKYTNIIYYQLILHDMLNIKNGSFLDNLDKPKLMKEQIKLFNEDQRILRNILNGYDYIDQISFVNTFAQEMDIKHGFSDPNVSKIDGYDDFFRENIFPLIVHVTSGTYGLFTKHDHMIEGYNIHVDKWDKPGFIDYEKNLEIIFKGKDHTVFNSKIFDYTDFKNFTISQYMREMTMYFNKLTNNMETNCENYFDIMSFTKDSRNIKTKFGFLQSYIDCSNNDLYYTKDGCCFVDENKLDQLLQTNMCNNGRRIRKKDFKQILKIVEVKTPFEEIVIEPKVFVNMLCKFTLDFYVKMEFYFLSCMLKRIFVLLTELSHPNPHVITEWILQNSNYLLTDAKRAELNIILNSSY
jgi:hypothetical protein